MQKERIFLTEYLKKSEAENLIYKPTFYRLNHVQDRLKFEELLHTPGIKLYDKLYSHLSELIKTRNPKRKYKKEDLSAEINTFLGDTPPEEYGLWVHYPWLNKIVHILDEEEFIEVRTSRNQYKITPEEREKLAQAKIGVLGLSVGQSVSLALSMERGFGELRVADFDILEMSNLNRIRSGVQDLGLLKTVSTARQIAEIDPFLKIKCFHDGLTEENMDNFLLDDGKLDILIDECDGLDIKILARQRARELGIPVLMETSDRGMVDIERFDLEPERPIMHGLIDHLEQNPRKLKGLSNEEKVPYVLPMVGLDTMSERLKASMLEIEQTITTWPQLASDVIMGGAITASLCRRMMLGKFQQSGRFFVDIDEIIKPGKEFQFKQEEKNSYNYTVDEQNFRFRPQMKFDYQLDLSENQLKEIVGAAVLAPSGGNSQPWKFIWQDKTLFLFLDKSRATSFLDFGSSGSYLSLGAATENLILKTHALGLKVHTEFFPDKENTYLAAIFRFFSEKTPQSLSFPNDNFDYLSSAIQIRLTNRLFRERKRIDDKKLNRIKSAGESIEGVQVSFLTNDNEIDAVGKIIAAVDRVMITHKEGHQGFVHEIRWSEQEAKETGDGIDLATLDISAGEAAGLKVAKNWSVVKTLNTWGGGSVFEKMSKKAAASAAAIGLLSINGHSDKDYFVAGRALERLWLEANQQQIAMQPMTALTFLLHRLVNGNAEKLTEKNIEQLKQVRREFVELYQLDHTTHPVFLFRLLIAEDPKVKSYRRPLQDVLEVRN